jgi:hypothetical protein
MSAICLSASARARRHPLFAGIASVFVLAAPTATLAATVTSCLDNVAGSLRQVIGAAGEGETIDFAGLTCVASTISLASEIDFSLNNLTIDGSGATTPLTIDASTIPHLPTDYGYFRVFGHGGSGTLTIKNLTLTGGYVHRASFTYQSSGGCISSIGSVTLVNSTVTNCDVLDSGTSFPARGGGVTTNGDLTLQNSTLSYNSATASGTNALGGGAYVGGDLTLKDNSSISHSLAHDFTAARGGGAFVKGKLTLQGGSLATNEANSHTDAKGGGAYVVGDTEVSSGGGAIYDQVNSSNGSAAGGGFYSAGMLTLSKALVAHNKVHGATFSIGGGAKVAGDFSASYTTIAYNAANGNVAYDGALRLEGLNNTIASSTISANSSDYNFGGVEALRIPGAGATLVVSNSTISGNQATNVGGGLYSNSGTTKLYNSTIAFNTGSVGDSAGLWLGTGANAVAATLKSNLIVYNAVGIPSQDFTVIGNSLTINGGNLAAAAKNLIGATAFPSASLPDDTLIGVCPRLGPLKDNGGLTHTHALLSKSVAIDNGNDSFGALYDQRGKASVTGDIDYTRFSGLTAIADIGAYEVQQNEIIFNVNFEGCPLL